MRVTVPVKLYGSELRTLIYPLNYSGQNASAQLMSKLKDAQKTLDAKKKLIARFEE